ncbi:helix-turn-helix transcriptional regulator [Chitinophaga niabensis]|uniref:helix-turn-helix transcriptional regulator n=1 Tax=Chitinophaga niabensis TaxID=536979 RepID=UPI0031BAD7D5
MFSLQEVIIFISLYLCHHAYKHRRYNRIKAMLALKHRTAKELAHYLQIAPQTVSYWATNSRQPHLDELFAIAEFLKVGPCELLEI